jgi:hypothetical protein
VALHLAVGPGWATVISTTYINFGAANCRRWAKLSRIGEGAGEQAKEVEVHGRPPLRFP